MKNKYLPESGYVRVAVVSLYAVLGIAVLYIAVKYLIGLFLPFIIAWVVAAMLQPLIQYICRRFRISNKTVSIFVVLLVFSVAGVLLFMLLERLIWEGGRLVSWLSENADVIVGETSDFLNNITDRLPITGTILDGEYITSAITDMIKGTLTSVSARVPEWIAAAAGILPRSLFFIVMLVMGCFYISVGYHELGGYIERRLPGESSDKVIRIREQLAKTGRRYLRAYATMFVITFTELLTGLLIFKIEYAFLMALIIAAVDILPVLGTGTILIPWGIILLFTGNYYTGFGLLIIYAVVTVVRQVIEPRIVGVSLGLHPLITLMAIYVGFRLFGVIGIILLPIITILTINIIRGEKFNKNIKNPKAAGS